MATERKRKGYTAEFKRNAVKLVLDGRHTCSSVERSLGVSPGIVYRWVRQYRASPQESFPGNGRLKPTDERIRVLERELQTARMERDILKKALAVFSRGPAKSTAS
jgi:transposase